MLKQFATLDHDNLPDGLKQFVMLQILRSLMVQIARVHLRFTTFCDGSVWLAQIDRLFLGSCEPHVWKHILGVIAMATITSTITQCLRKAKAMWAGPQSGFAVAAEI